MTRLRKTEPHLVMSSQCLSKRTRARVPKANGSIKRCASHNVQLAVQATACEGGEGELCVGEGMCCCTGPMQIRSMTMSL